MQREPTAPALVQTPPGPGQSSELWVRLTLNHKQQLYGSRTGAGRWGLSLHDSRASGYNKRGQSLDKIEGLNP